VGNTFCKSCVSSLDKCPLCRATLNISHFVSTKIVKSIVDALKVKCIQCNAAITRGEYENHIKKCPIPCKLGCGMSIEPYNQKLHEESECNNFILSCNACYLFCDWQGTRYHYIKHQRECQFLANKSLIEFIASKFKQKK